MESANMGMNKALSTQLDAIRGYASLLVLLTHVYAWFMRPITGGKDILTSVFGSLGFFAVLVFFVLSGYLITNSLLSNFKRNGEIRIPEFVSARAFRILPPFVFAIILSIVVAWGIDAFQMHGHDSFKLPGDQQLVRDNVQLNERDVIFSILLSNGVVPGTNAIITNGPLWTLSIEVWLYFIGLLFTLACITRFRGSTAQASLIGLVGMLLLLSYKPLLFEFGVYWFLGAAFRWHQEFAAGRIWRNVVFVLLGLPGALICLKKPLMLAPQNQQGYSLVINLMVILALTGILLLVPKKFTIWEKPGEWLANSSYTLYIIHFPILTLLFSIFHQAFMGWGEVARLLFLIGIFILNLLVAHIAALVLENRLLWKRVVFFVAQSIARAFQLLRAKFVTSA